MSPGGLQNRCEEGEEKKREIMATLLTKLTVHLNGEALPQLITAAPQRRFIGLEIEFGDERELTRNLAGLG